MQRADRKNPRLKARVDALARELARTDDEIRSLSRAVSHPDRETAMRRLKRLADEQAQVRDVPGLRGATRPEDLPRDVVPAAAPSREPAAAEPQGAGSADAFPKPPSDSRFAKYFVTGSLHTARPLRQERRVQRNKAIIMTIVAIAILYGVFSLIF